MSDRDQPDASPQQASLEELGGATPEPSRSGGASESPSSPALGEAESTAWRRVRAGLLVEAGQADKKVARRWQEAVQKGAFEPDACANELLTGAPAPNPAQLERCARLQRDLLMAPLVRGARGAGRKMREAGRGFFAMLVSQLVIVAIYTFVILAALLLVRAKGFGLDSKLDLLLGPLAPAESEAPEGD